MAVVMLDGVEQQVSNIFCIGRNYAAHVAELGNQLEEEPLVFLKPTSALTLSGQPMRLPAYSADVHHECELVLLIGKGGSDIAAADALSHIAGVGIGLDLTARDVQSEAERRQALDQGQGLSPCGLRVRFCGVPIWMSASPSASACR
jgi:2-keto-4-pentenoate hydratase/2-oxohepta-3-ene-1,7-dioic acid hydratase in catechol pathway